MTSRDVRDVIQATLTIVDLRLTNDDNYYDKNVQIYFP